MSDFSVVKIGPRQYKVSKGDVITVEKTPSMEEGKKVTFPEVLLSQKKENITLGKPFIEKSTVEGKVIQHIKGKKVHTRVYKSKSRYRKAHGSRQRLAKIEITKI